MRTSFLPWILAALAALPASAAGSTRIKVENTSDPSSRVTISFSEQARKPARLAVGNDGMAELVVEAPSPRLRLSGGTLQSDPRIELLASRQDREASPAPALYVIDSFDSVASFAPHDGPLVYDDAVSWWGGAGWGMGGWQYSPRDRRGFDSGGGRRNSGDRGPRHEPRMPSPQRSASFRGVVAHAGR